MSTITPILDTLLHQVLGRRADMARFTATRPNAPLLAVARLPGARDATTQTGLQAERALQTKTAGKARPAAADDGSRAANARTSGILPRAASGTAAGGALSGAAGQGSAQLHFSPGARAISALLTQFPAAPMAAARAPLFNGATPPLPRMLAPVLAQQLAHSGVFYESHLRQWIEGKRSLRQLGQEPQARLSKPGAARAPAGARATSTPAPQAPGNAVAAPSAGASAPATAASTQASTAGPSAFGLAAMRVSAAEPIHDSLLPVVRQQLDVLHSAAFRWDGFAWPDVPMQWEIEEHEALQDEAGEGGGADASSYSTRLKLELPVLGALEVQLTLSANTVQMYAWAASDRGAAALAPHTEALQQRLERAGFDAARVDLLTGTPE